MTETDLNLAVLYWQEENRGTKMNKPDITMIDFKTWAENIVLLARENGIAQEEIERALEQAYSQGYNLGLNNGWAIEQDKEISQEEKRHNSRLMASGDIY